MKDARGLDITLPTDQEILLTRGFDASRQAVFEAWTNAEHVKHWWDPSGVPLSSCEIDLRPGGSFRWVNSAHGIEHAFTGTYREIVSPERLVFVVSMFPLSACALTEMTLRDDGGRTSLAMRIQCASREDRDALLRMRIDAGTARSLENLASYLGNLGTIGERRS